MGKFIDAAHVFLENCKTLRENPLLLLYVADCSDLARVLTNDVYKIQVGFHGSDSRDMLATMSRISSCQNLTDLSIVSKVISYKTIRELSNAVRKNNLRHLISMSLVDCKATLKKGGNKT